MKRLIILLSLLLSSAAFATDYVFGPGDEFGALSLFDYDTLLMTGGGGMILIVLVGQPELSTTLTHWSALMKVVYGNWIHILMLNSPSTAASFMK